MARELKMVDADAHVLEPGISILLPYLSRIPRMYVRAVNCEGYNMVESVVASISL